MRSLTKALALFALLAGALSGLAAQEVDLTAFDAYVRPGFEIAWVYSRPEPADQAWVRVPAQRGDRPIILGNYGFAGLPRPTPLRILPAKPAEFTVAIPFVATESLLAIPGGIGLYLAQIGENWEVYLNGSLIATEVHRRADGAIRLDRTVRGLLLPIDRRYILSGTNVLAFRLVGDPLNDRTGFGLSGPYLVGAYERLAALRTEYVDLMLIGVYAFFAFYHLMLFTLRSSNKSYLWFGLGTLFVALYFFCRSFIVFDLIGDGLVIRTLEMGSLYLVAPFFVLFFEQALRRRVGRPALGYLAFCIVLALASPFLVRTSLLNLWSLSIPFAGAYLVVLDLAIPFARAYKHYHRQARLRGPLGSIGTVFDVLIRTEVGRLTLSLLVVVIAAAYDLLAVERSNPLQVSRYAFLFLVLGAAGVLAAQFVGVFREIEAINTALDRKVMQRAEALEKSVAEQTGLNRELSEANLRLQGAMEVASKDMRMAVQVQRGFFPSMPPQTPGWDLAFAYLPAAGISGDFYDFYVDGGLLSGILVGDVSGHGIASGLVTVLARSVFQRNVSAMPESSLGRVLEAIDAELSKELAAVENYLTCTLLRVGDGTVEYANAASPDAAFRQAGKSRAVLLRPKDNADYRGTPLGREGFNSQHVSVRFAMNPGDALLVATDGLAEARNVDGEAFRESGLLEAFGSAPDGDASQMLDYVMQEWRFHTSGAPVNDDLTAIILKRRAV